MTLQLVAAIPIGFDKVVAREVRALGGGIGKTTARAGRIFFEGPADAVYRTNLRLRTAERILLQVGAFSARVMTEWGDQVASIAWENWVPRGSSVRLHASTRACRLFHTGAMHEALREAMVGRGLDVRAPAGPRDGRAKGPSCAVDIRGTADHFVVCVDTSGAGLHRRGYRKETAKAPLRETIAASLLQRVGWTPAQRLLDPMCGSGTFVIEGACMAQRREPGMDRSFAFEQFPCFDKARWQQLLQQSREQLVADGGGAGIEGSDRQSGAVRAARNNVRRAGMPAQVRIEQRALEDLEPDSDGGLIVMNPPYGRRLEGAGDEVLSLETWSSWGAAVRETRPGWDLLLLAPAPEFARAFGAKGKPIVRFRNGGLPVSAWHIRAGR